MSDKSWKKQVSKAVLNYMSIPASLKKVFNYEATEAGVVSKPKQGDYMNKYRSSKQVVENPTDYPQETRDYATAYVEGYEDRTKELLDRLKERRTDCKALNNTNAPGSLFSSGRIRELNHIISLLKSEEE